MSEINFSIVITTYNRYDRLFPFIKKYETYNNVYEILILDDCSNDYSLFMSNSFSSKVKIFTNNKNIGAYQNKIKALSKVDNDWAILFDSDNFFDQSFLDRLQKENIEYGLNEDIIYCPSKALPVFDYSNLSNVIIDKSNWNKISSSEEYFINTGNMCLSKKAINFLISNLEVDPIKQPFVECKYMNYLFVKNNFKLKALKGLEYCHAISHDSFYLSHESKHINFNSTFNWTI